MMTVPGFVREFTLKAVGLPVAFISPVASFSGVVQAAFVEGRRIKYEVKDATGRIRLVYADQVSHLNPNGVTISG
jgi:hypothetical protein